MKTFRLIGMIFTVLVTTTFLTGCSDDYDDSLLTNRVDDLENRVSKLEELCSQMNTNISSLQAIINALEDKDYITNVTPITKEERTIGYTITFAKGNPITIYHGKDGNNGSTPFIGVKKHTDGIYYWTVNNEWLLDEDGNKIKAEGTDGKDGSNGEDGKNGEDGTDGSDGGNGSNGADGKDGVTPKLKIEEGYWYVSYDNGTTWTELGKATGEDGKDGDNGTNGTDGKDGDSFFQSVDTSQTDYVVFKLSNGTEIKLPTWTAFENLQTLCNQMNTNITSLQTIVNALQNNDYIKSVTPVMENGKEIGYTITFAKSNAITIYHGKDGEDGNNGSNGTDGSDGKDGSTPIIGVKKHTDGIYYWTVNNEWLLDEDGNKVKAQGTDGSDGGNGSNGADGKDGVTPKLKIEEGYWYVSYDNGTTWTELGKATGEDGKDGDNIFSSVTQDEDNVYFNLVNGTIIIVSKNGSSTPKPTDYIQFEDVNVKALCLNWDTNYDGELSYEEAANVTSLGTTFKENTTIRLFKELQYFTNLTTLENAFNGCTNLVYVNIPSNVTNMTYAFYGCTSLISAIVPNNVTDLSYAFYNCTSLVKSNISSIAKNLNYSFYECNKLEGSLIIPNTVTSLDVAFKNCYLVSEIKFESGSTITEFPAFKRGTIGNWNKGAFDSTFRGCKSIKSFVVPASVEIINLSTFYECTSLEIIQFEENSKLKEIISEAYDGTNTSYRSPFEDCTSLKTFDASNCLNEYSFDQKTFSVCQSLTTVIMPKITEIGDEFNSALVTIEIPNVKEITSKAFANCTSLKNVTMQSVESIWESAFYNCTSLEKITLPSTIKSIGKMAFYGCKSLVEVNCKAVTPPTLGDSTFYDVSSSIIINVPNSSLDDYKSETSWANYVGYIKGADL